MFCVRPSAEPWCQCLGFVVSGCLHVLMFYIIHTCKTVNTRTGGNKNIDLFFNLLLKVDYQNDLIESKQLYNCNFCMTIMTISPYVDGEQV